jgi:GTP cyclohydrolase I
MTTQIAEAVWQNLHPLGVGVRVRARHLCMESRGICQQGHDTTTTALRGVFRDDPAARAEFIGACGS